MAAIGPAHHHATHTAVLSKEWLHRFTSNDIGAPLRGFVEHHAIEMAATNLPGCPRGQLPLRRARADGNEPSVHSLRSINFHTMFHRILSPRHILLKAESSE